MRKLQKTFVVVTMLGSVGVLGAGTAQADDTTGVNNATVPPTCTSTAVGGDGGAGGSATISDNEINQVNIAIVGLSSTITQTNEVTFTATGGAGGQGGDATAACN